MTGPMVFELSRKLFDVPPATASFRVVFYDGNRETEIGPVIVDASHRFGKLQSDICRKISMPPNQISIFLVRHGRTLSSQDGDITIPIHEGSDLAAVVKEKDCFLLATLRSTRGRGRQRQNENQEVVNTRSELEKMTICKAEKATVGRPSQDPLATMSTATGNVNSNMYRLPRSEYLNRERTPMPRNMTPSVSKIAEKSIRLHDRFVEKSSADDPVCKICSGENGSQNPPFHLCVNDPIVFDFHTKSGPIQRPSKGHVKDALARLFERQIYSQYKLYNHRRRDIGMLFFNKYW